MRRSVLAAVAVAVVSLLLAGPAGAAAASPASAPAPGAEPAKLSVAVQLTRMTVHGRVATASADALATLKSAQGKTTTTRSRVTLSATSGGGCRVLHLFLQQLNLNLLGLVANLDKVNLDVVGHANGGVLGQLFCRLSRGITGRIADRRASQALTASLRQHPAVLRFTATLTPQAQTSQAPPAAACPVLDLVLGPLNLNLLGLEVNLNQVHLNVVANPGGGALGSLFCQLANARIVP